MKNIKIFEHALFIFAVILKDISEKKLKLQNQNIIEIFKKLYFREILEKTNSLLKHNSPK